MQIHRKIQDILGIKAMKNTICVVKRIYIYISNKYMLLCIHDLLAEHILMQYIHSHTCCILSAVTFIDNTVIVCHFIWLVVFCIFMFLSLVYISSVLLHIHVYCLNVVVIPGIILGMGSANERRCYIVTSSLIGWDHTKNDHCNTDSIHDKSEITSIKTHTYTYIYIYMTDCKFRYHRPLSIHYIHTPTHAHIFNITIIFLISTITEVNYF